jgi:hypothetical protein
MTPFPLAKVIMKICDLGNIKVSMDLEFLVHIKVIQVDIGGHPNFIFGSKQFSDNFGNLLFLAVFNF